MKSNIVIRKALASDREFIFSLSPNLAEVAKLDWHSDATVAKMQDGYIEEMLAESQTPNSTFVAEMNGTQLGFIHVRLQQDAISNEPAALIPLLAISAQSQGLGIGQQLISVAQSWAKELGCRLLQLEVFANNDNAIGFYKKQGFKPEIMQMTKVI